MEINYKFLPAFLAALALSTLLGARVKAPARPAPRAVPPAPRISTAPAPPAPSVQTAARRSSQIARPAPALDDW